MKRALRFTAFAALALASAGVPLACSGNKPNPPVTPTPAVDAAPDAEAGPIAMGVADAGVADAAPLAVADAAPPNLATLQDPAIDLALTTAATKDAPGMTPDGPVGRATLAENEHFGMLVTMAPNRCYTVIGFSPPGQVSNLEVKIMAPPLYNVQVAASGANDKSLPVVAKGKNALCPLLPVPIAYKLDVTAKKGTGRIGVQVFAKNK
jgi:hypothetical protein